jgi:putative DNA methylase
VKAAQWLHARTNCELTVDFRHTASAVRGAEPPMDDDVRVVEGSSEHVLLPDDSVQLTLTDPPYADDVQYAELSMPLRAWADLSSADLVGEAVVNGATGQLVKDGDYEALLTSIFAENKRVLRIDGHLIFSYANRDPDAWVAVFNALQAAGFRAVGCEIVHSENETDLSKRGVRACSLDLLLDLVPAEATVSGSVEQHQPSARDPGHEADFLRVVAKQFLQVGRLELGWQQRFVHALRSTAFLTN